MSVRSARTATLSRSRCTASCTWGRDPPRHLCAGTSACGRARESAGALTGGRDGRRDVRGVLGHDDRKPGLEVEVDVAVEEPRAGVVRREADRDVVARRARADDVALRGVHVVVVGAAGGADDVEGVAVQVEGVRLARRVRGHREGDLDRRVGREGVDAAAREEVGGGERAGHDLEQDRDGRRDEGLAVDEEVGAVLCGAVRACYGG